MSPLSSMRRDGVRAGLLGALVVALWFLSIDVMQGRPLLTPSVLGQVLLFGVRSPATVVIQPLAVVAYTVLHIILFIALGLLVSVLLDLALQHGIVRFALLMLTVVFEVFFWGLLEIGLEATRGLFPFWSVLVGNTLAAASMGLFFYRRHPALKDAFLREALGS